MQPAIYDCDFPWILGESPKVFSLRRYPWNVACHLFHYSIINFHFDFESEVFFTFVYMIEVRRFEMSCLDSCA